MPRAKKRTTRGAQSTKQTPLLDIHSETHLDDLIERIETYLNDLHTQINIRVAALERKAKQLEQPASQNVERRKLPSSVRNMLYIDYLRQGGMMDVVEAKVAQKEAEREEDSVESKVKRTARKRPARTPTPSVPATTRMTRSKRNANGELMPPPKSAPGPAAAISTAKGRRGRPPLFETMQVTEKPHLGTGPVNNLKNCAMLFTKNQSPVFNPFSLSVSELGQLDSNALRTLRQISSKLTDNLKQLK